MHDVPKPQPTATADLGRTKETFRARAKRLRSVSFGILGIIFLLLVGGAAAFVLAPQITLSDFYPHADTDKKLAAIEQEIDRLNKPLQDSLDAHQAWRDKLTAELKLYFDVVQNYETRKFSNRKGAGNSVSGSSSSSTFFCNDDNQVEFDSTNAAQKTKVIDQIERLKGQAGICLIDRWNDITHMVPSSQVPPMLAELYGLSVPQLPPEPRDYELDQASHDRMELLQKARGILSDDKQQRELAGIIGEKPPQGENATHPETTEKVNDLNAVPLAQVIQTNVTRFGTIIMIIFLVSILTPLYRYNIRLATYYEARADALELLDTPLNSIGFVELASAVTPTFDFSKAPPTPIEHLIELVRQFNGKPGKKKNRSSDVKRLAAQFSDAVQLAGYAQSGERRVHHQARAFPGEVIDQR